MLLQPNTSRHRPTSLRHCTGARLGSTQGERCNHWRRRQAATRTQPWSSFSPSLALAAGLLGCTGQVEESADVYGESAGLAAVAPDSAAAGSATAGSATADSAAAGEASNAPAPEEADSMGAIATLGGGEIGVASVLASIAEQRYRKGFPWVKVNQEAFPSAVASAMIDVWVSGVGAQAYATIAPELRIRGEEVPPGTLVVREVWNDAGEVSKLTLMLKGPPGYNPDLGDFWFGETDPSGTPLEDEAGAPRLGRLDGCYGCHVPRAEQGYLFGAPAGNRMPYL